MSGIPKEVFRPVTTIEMVDAVETLISLHVAYPGTNLKDWPQSSRDIREMARRTLADGFRYHSAGAGVVSGEDTGLRVKHP